MMSRYIKIISIEGLKASIDKGVYDYCISNGLLRSSKHINRTVDGKFMIINEIDGSEELLTEDELKDSHIAKCMKNGTFYAYVWD